MTVLNCPRVVNENGDFESVSMHTWLLCLLHYVLQRWFINGTRNCFTGSHVSLGLWSIVVLLVCSVLIPFLVLVAVKIIKVGYVMIYHSLKNVLSTEATLVESLV